MSWRRTVRAREIEPGQIRMVTVDDDNLVICRVDDREVFAVEDKCSHDDGPLSQGSFSGAVLECPRHGARFDVRTGAALRMPAAAPIETFPARITDDGWIEVELT